ncbi:MAG: ribonuclease R [Dinoroseobacter sp.]|jgi:ribonuclease R
MKSLPTKDEILDFITQNPRKANKRDIARQFGIKGAARIDLKAILRELQGEGHLEKHEKRFHDPSALPPVAMTEALAPDADGDLFLKALEWSGEGDAPRVLFVAKPGEPGIGAGDRLLVRLSKVEAEDYTYEARLIKRVGTKSDARRILGVFRKSAEGGRIQPIEKKIDKEWRVAPGAVHGAVDGELVEAEEVGGRTRMGLPGAQIVARLGEAGSARTVSLMAIHTHGIPDDFPQALLDEADRAKPQGLGKREDLRDVPLLTIDPADARDRDDAVCAVPDPDPANPGGHILWVAIADVSAYVTPGSAMDTEARMRGNSTYFPDRVVPMLPDRLSGDLCSLHEDVPRACIAVRMVLAEDGTKLSHRFVRGLMQSKASLSYEQAQAAIDGQPDETTAPLLETVLKPLWAAYASLFKARERRQPLALDLPERRIVLGEDGQVSSVAFSQRFDAHKLIEECMVLANVAAAETLAEKDTPLLYRVHEQPTPEKMEALREVAKAAGLTLAKGEVLQTAHLNRLLEQAAGREDAELINISTLRSMTQAFYSPQNFGHFGLALTQYAHFTSPIRRYADLIVHRALIKAHGWGKDGLSNEDEEMLEQTAITISQAERRSMMAERDTNDRYLAAYLSDRIGAEFPGRISGIARFGVFVKLDESGADGLVPMRSLGQEYFRHDAEANTLTGADTGTMITLGQRVLVRLAEATPITGGLLLEILEIEGQARKSRSPTRRKHKGKPLKGRTRSGAKPGKPRGIR